MLIIDGDYPMAFGAMDLNRDLTLPIEEVRKAKPDHFSANGWPDSDTLASLPEMRHGKIAVALVKIVARHNRIGSPLWGYRGPEVTYAAARAQMIYYQMLEIQNQVKIIRNRLDLTNHLQLWSSTVEHSNLPVGLIVGMEGADPILQKEQVQQWWKEGLRVISLSHYGISTYCHGTGTGTTGGLFPPAKALLREMETNRIILDVTHASDASAREAMELFNGPVIASHQNCRSLVPGERQFPDDLLTSVIQRGGVIGVSMDSWMLYKGGRDWSNPQPQTFSREDITLEDYVDHIDYICQLAGNSLHAAIGGDTDGQGGRAGAPAEIDTVADYQKISKVLEDRNYSSEEIANILYRNWQRFFENSLPEGNS